MHTALYRKYRPKTFTQVVGQKYVVEALKNQIANGKIGHAFLFTGTRGTGKTSCAKIFAKAINCQNPKNGEPCLECEVCKGIENESIYDVTEMDAASNNSVEDIRDVLNEVMYLPVMAKYRVYIIDEVHMLTTAAFNALLKTLEEPPAHVVFILATTELHKVPATILSRCQRYDFHKLSIEEIGEALLHIAQEENISLSTQAAKIIASLADGAMRDATSILDTCLSMGNVIDQEVVANVVGISKEEELFDFAQALIDADMPKALQTLLTLEQRSVDLKRLCEELMTHFRNLLLANLPGSNAQLLNTAQPKFEQMKLQANTTTSAFVSWSLAVFTTAIDSIGKGQSAKIALDIAVYTLCNNQVQQSSATVVRKTQPVVASQQPAVNASIIEQPSLQQNLPEDLEPLQPTTQTPRQNPPENTSDQKRETLPVQQTDVPVVFPYWAQVIERIGQTDMPFHSFIRNSKAYLFENVVYIDGNEGLNNYIRTNKEASALVKKAILEACGKAYNIGGYKNIAKRFDKKEDNSLTDILALRENGVKVNIQD